VTFVKPERTVVAVLASVALLKQDDAHDPGLR
jgi:hypothetical protein